MNGKLLVPIGLIVAGLIIAGAVVYANTNSCPEISGGISGEEAGERTMSFINENILRGQAVASLIETTEENGIYKVVFEVEGQEAEWRISKDGAMIFPQAIDLTETQDPVEEEGVTIGNFSVSTDEVCLEDNKPVVYFFGSESCPHCVWEHPVVQEVMAKFEGVISFHDNMENGENMDIFDKYSTGGIPAIVLGCKYYRVGSGENQGKETEVNNLTALVCSLTNGQPGEVCDQVQDLINQI